MQTKQIMTNYWDYKDKKFRFDIYTASSFEGLNNVKQVYGIMLNKDKNKVMVVFNKSNMWILPGGSVEEGETQLDTLIREIKEETNCDIDLSSVKPMFYQEEFLFNNETQEWVSRGLQLRYSAVVETEREFIEDPDHGDIIETKWITFNEIPQYLKWGKVSILIQNQLNSIQNP